MGLEKSICRVYFLSCSLLLSAPVFGQDALIDDAQALNEILQQDQEASREICQSIDEVFAESGPGEREAARQRNDAIMQQAQAAQAEQEQWERMEQEFCQSASACSDPGQGSIQIPDGMGDVYTITCYGIPGWFLLNHQGGGHWSRIFAGSMQDSVHEAWVAAGACYSDGIAVLSGRYLIACTPLFGNVGDMVTFYLADGTAVPCLVADAKAQEVTAWDPSPANEWGHLGGRNVLEFEVDKDYYFAYGNPGSGGWHMEFAQRVCSARWEGPYFP